MPLTAENISKSFGEKQVLRNFSHEFPDGKITFIMGASGCGKSTLLNILMGILLPDGGRVIGNDVRKSAVFQEDRLCENLSVLSNLRLISGKKADNAVLIKELERVGLKNDAYSLARTLSGGMKRRLALVRALNAEYDILFLDEPFKGLDEETKQSVMSYCLEKIRGRTVIAVTHERSEAEFFVGEIISV